MLGVSYWDNKPINKCIFRENQIEMCSYKLKVYRVLSFKGSRTNSFLTATTRGGQENTTGCKQSRSSGPQSQWTRFWVCQGQIQNEGESHLGVIPHLIQAFSKGRHHTLIGWEGNTPSCFHSSIRSRSPPPAHRWSESTAISPEDSGQNKERQQVWNNGTDTDPLTQSQWQNVTASSILYEYLEF